MTNKRNRKKKKSQSQNKDQNPSNPTNAQESSNVHVEDNVETIQPIETVASENLNVKEESSNEISVQNVIVNVEQEETSNEIHDQENLENAENNLENVEKNDENAENNVEDDGNVENDGNAEKSIEKSETFIHVEEESNLEVKVENAQDENKNVSSESNDSNEIIELNTDTNEKENSVEIVQEEVSEQVNEIALENDVTNENKSEQINDIAQNKEEVDQSLIINDHLENQVNENVENIVNDSAQVEILVNEESNQVEDHSNKSQIQQEDEFNIQNLSSQKLKSELEQNNTQLQQNQLESQDSSLGSQTDYDSVNEPSNAYHTETSENNIHDSEVLLNQDTENDATSHSQVDEDLEEYNQPQTTINSIIIETEELYVDDHESTDVRSEILISETIDSQIDESLLKTEESIDESTHKTTTNRIPSNISATFGDLSSDELSNTSGHSTYYGTPFLNSDESLANNFSIEVNKQDKHSVFHEKIKPILDQILSEWLYEHSEAAKKLVLGLETKELKFENLTFIQQSNEHIQSITESKLDPNSEFNINRAKAIGFEVAITDFNSNLIHLEYRDEVTRQFSIEHKNKIRQNYHIQNTNKSKTLFYSRMHKMIQDNRVAYHANTQELTTFVNKYGKNLDTASLLYSLQQGLKAQLGSQNCLKWTVNPTHFMADEQFVKDITEMLQSVGLCFDSSSNVLDLSNQTVNVDNDAVFYFHPEISNQDISTMISTLKEISRSSVVAKVGKWESDPTLVRLNFEQQGWWSTIRQFFSRLFGI